MSTAATWFCNCPSSKAPVRLYLPMILRESRVPTVIAKFRSFAFLRILWLGSDQKCNKSRQPTGSKIVGNHKGTGVLKQVFARFGGNSACSPVSIQERKGKNLRIIYSSPKHKQTTGLGPGKGFQFPWFESLQMSASIFHHLKSCSIHFPFAWVSDSKPGTVCRSASRACITFWRPSISASVRLLWRSGLGTVWDVACTFDDATELGRTIYSRKELHFIWEKLRNHFFYFLFTLLISFNAWSQGRENQQMTPGTSHTLHLLLVGEGKSRAVFETKYERSWQIRLNFPRGSLEKMEHSLTSKKSLASINMKIHILSDLWGKEPEWTMCLQETLALKTNMLRSRSKIWSGSRYPTPNDIGSKARFCRTLWTCTVICAVLWRHVKLSSAQILLLTSSA